jgi:hypothetical protein
LEKRISIKINQGYIYIYTIGSAQQNGEWLVNRKSLFVIFIDFFRICFDVRYIS